jgi:hypothetical protein
MKSFLLTILLIILTTFCSESFAEKKFRYEYVDRKHTSKEIAGHLGAMYGITWAIYPLSQWDTFKNDGSWENYKSNFGQIVFDKDEAIWNWVIHPFSGSQLFLFYRANGFSRISSLTMSFISSALFEFTVEIYTEPASIQDLYQTPIFGALLGIGIEKVSLSLLNSEYKLANYLGHILNPSTLFWFYEGKVFLTPTIDKKRRVGLSLMVDF